MVEELADLIEIRGRLALFRMTSQSNLDTLKGMHFDMSSRQPKIDAAFL